MKVSIAFLIIMFVVIGCKPDNRSVLNFDMSIFCEKYIVLVPPGSKAIYVFINRKDMKRRFVVFKDFNYLQSGYGYMYATTFDINTSLKSGVFNSAKGATTKAENTLEQQESYDLFLHNITWLGQGQWSAYWEYLKRYVLKSNDDINSKLLNMRSEWWLGS